MGVRLGFPATTATRLAGGHLNRVHRLEGLRGSAILKVAPPHVATNPRIPLDPSRNRHERLALLRAAEVLGPERVPAVLGHSDEHHALLLEDLGPGRSLPLDEAFLHELGATIGRLHRDTWGDGDRALANPSVQATRHIIQYRQVPAWLEAHGHDPRLGQAVVELGIRLRDEPGQCFVMGDLWPQAVHLRPDGHWALIDWELAHHGRPLQDTAHLRAHLFLLDPDPRWPDAFDAAYRTSFPEHAPSPDAPLHEAAELLARTVGAFPLFPEGDPRIERAVHRAVDLLSRRRILPRTRTSGGSPPGS
jgi:hypothetical protein